ncbi:hypothetical protein [Thiofilum flexile]|uniref:hypothetical protein n=1 Tax=Thiofilum flexile TaxID=125627 RepID=UPI00037A2E00|nr:hypothetical protein [Thiofilum flexile]
MAAVNNTVVECPHCKKTFDYPIPQEIPAQGDELIKSTTCPICEGKIKVRFEISREVEVMRGGSTDKRVIKAMPLIKAEKGE